MASRTSFVDFSQRAQGLYERANELASDSSAHRKELLDLNNQVEKLASEILCAGKPVMDQDISSVSNALTLLGRTRAVMIPNTSHQRYPKALYFNSICGHQVPAITNMAYKEPQIPFVTIYNGRSNLTSLYRVNNAGNNNNN